MDVATVTVYCWTVTMSLFKQYGGRIGSIVSSPPHWQQRAAVRSASKTSRALLVQLLSLDTVPLAER